MKIVINAASAKMGGAASYITNLLRQLSAEGGGTEFLVFLPPETAAKLPDLEGHVRVFPTRIGSTGLLRRLWWEQVALRRFLSSQKADTLYSSANFAMFFCPVRQVLLVRNALYFSRTVSRSIATPLAFDLSQFVKSSQYSLLYSQISESSGSKCLRGIAAALQ